jgi:hypothetical protein
MFKVLFGVTFLSTLPIYWKNVTVLVLNFFQIGQLSIIRAASTTANVRKFLVGRSSP